MSYNELVKGRYFAENQEYLITFVTRNRQPLFKNHALARLFINHLKIQNSTWLAWVLMPDHFHGLLQLTEGQLSTVIQSLKAKSAININQFLKSQGSIWQKGFYDRALRQEDDRKKIAKYLLANPLRAKLVNKIEDYPF